MAKVTKPDVKNTPAPADLETSVNQDAATGSGAEEFGVKHENGAAAAAEPAQPEALVSVDALAADFRLPSWQAAALHRLMHWEKDKKVSRDEYAAALETLKKRPLGA